VPKVGINFSYMFCFGITYAALKKQCVVFEVQLKVYIKLHVGVLLCV
jgi:hypothetical protein